MVTPTNPIIDQRLFPRNHHQSLTTVEHFRAAITDMTIRGAGLIGATAGYGMSIAAQTASKDNFEADLKASAEILIKSRPTASNLAWAVNRQLNVIASKPGVEEKVQVAIEGFTEPSPMKTQHPVKVSVNMFYLT